METVMVVSPHFDDGIFSVAGFLLQIRPSILLVNVCAGIPRGSMPLSRWDRRCGFQSGEEAAESRRIEDSKAWSELRVTRVDLPFLDLPYSNGTASAVIADALREYLTEVHCIWAPMGIGQHPDHISSRNAVLDLAAESALNVQLYADAPYASARGWLTDDLERDEVFRWETAFRSIKAQGYSLASPKILNLSKQLMARKLALVSSYHSQLRQLKTYYPGLQETTGELSHEALWEIAHHAG